MKKIMLMLGLFFLALPSFSQIPTGYYNNAVGLTGEQLKVALHAIIDDHTEYPYSSSNTDVWDILKETDKDPNNSSNVILLYTGWSVNAAQEYNSGSGWNREHVWAKSHGNFGTTMGAGTDVHHLRPTDISVNSARNSRWFDEGDFEYIDGDGATGSYTSSTNWVWEPRPEVKGDVARMIFYMATRYEGTNGEPDLELVDYLPADNFTADPIHAKLSTLITWHNADPVDAFEINRNNVIYSYQGNRNPFIDHPEYVTSIYGGSTTPDTEAPTVPTNITSSNTTTSSSTINWTTSTDNIGVTSYEIELDGSFYQSVSTTMVNISGLSNNTNYTVGVKALDAAGNSSSIATVSVTTLSTGGGTGGSTSTETFDGFSEGGSYQSGTFTGVNGTTWTYASARGDIAITGSAATLGKGKSPAGAVTSGVITGGVGVLNFDYMQAFSTGVNLNVYVNGVLVGNVSGGTQNTVVSSGDIVVNSTGNSTIVFEQTSTSAGQVAIDNISWSTNSTIDTEAPTTPSNVSSSNTTTSSSTINWTASTDNVGVTGYEVELDGSFYQTVTTTSLDIVGLSENTNYMVGVKALDAAGNSSSIATVSVTTLSTGGGTGGSTSTETFDGFSEGGSYQSGTFTGVDGTTWTYASARGDIAITGSAATLGKGKSPAGAVTSGVITGGVSVLNFDYMQAFSTGVNLNVYVNGVLVGNVSGGTQNTVVSSGDIVVNSTGNSTIVFEQASSTAGQVAIDNISWTSTGGVSNTNEIVFENYFETGWDNWTDGGSDCYRYSGAYSYEGNYSIRLRDNSGGASSMTSASFDLTSFSDLVFEADFYSYSMESGEDFFVQYSSDNGVTWTTIATYVSGTDFNNSEFTHLSIPISSASLTFSSNVKFRIQCDASTNSDQVYIDAVIVSTSGVGTKKYDDDKVISDIKTFNATSNLNASPNPAHHVIKLECTNFQGERYAVVDQLGQVVLSDKISDDGLINVSELQPGLYFVLVWNQKQEKVSTRVIIY